MQQDLAELRKVKTLYSRKEQLIMPLLSQMGISGPSDVMWGVDDEIKQTVSALSENVTADSLQEMAGDVTALTKRMREMIYKEENILFPMALEKRSRQPKRRRSCRMASCTLGRAREPSPSPSCRP